MCGNTLAERIKHYRKLKNMTQEQLAINAGLNLSSIGNYESGRRQPDSLTLKKIALFLDINPIDLMPEFDEGRKDIIEEARRDIQSIPLVPVSAIEKIILHKFRQLTPKQQEKLLLECDQLIVDNYDEMAERAGIAEERAEYNAKSPARPAGGTKKTGPAPLDKKKNQS